MKTVINNFSKYRFLLVELVKKDIRLKYRRSYLGIVWTLLEPLMNMLVLYFVFKELKKGDPLFPIYILSGRLLYSFFSTSTKAAMKSIRSNSGMIKKVYVPKYIYPLSSIISNYVIFLISLIILVGTAIVLKVQPTIYMLNAIFPLILIFVMSLGVGLILATMAVFFRDLEYLWSVALTLIMYCCAIFYPASTLGKNEWILSFNPLYALIANFRNAIYGVPMNMNFLIYGACFSFASLMIGIIVFYKKQDKFILNI